MDNPTPVRDDWTHTPTGEPRGYIEPHALDELWFHTGTACNLACPFCLEGSKPGDNRLNRVTLADLKPFIDEALPLGVRQFSFTGGEPFIVRDFVNILRYAASHRPCLVLTNGTEPVLKRLDQIRTLTNTPQPISFRISIDYPDPSRHDAGRGAGTFDMSWRAMKALHDLGFTVSLARQMAAGEDDNAVRISFQHLMTKNGLPQDLTQVAFPDFSTPGVGLDVPYVTTSCMTTYQTAETRRAFMCAFSKMVVKKSGRMRVYACTLVDDDERYDQGGALADSLKPRVMLSHHRCYSCFAYGSSCSEL